MKTIELKSIDEGYFFQCAICNQFPELPIECIHCNKWYCYTCKNLLNSIEIRGCGCEQDYLQIIEPFQQYVYCRLTIKCQICQELLPLNQSKKHSIKCENQQSNQNQFNHKGIKKFNLIQKIQSFISYPVQENQTYDPDNMNFCKNLKYEQCQIFEIQSSNLKLSNLSEDAINQLQSIIYQCELCLEEGNSFIMRQHHFICKQEIVSCICGLNCKRRLIKDHIQQCLKEQIVINQNNNSQICYALNQLKIAFDQQLIQNLHDFQIIFYNNEFQSQNQDYETKFIF